MRVPFLPAKLLGFLCKMGIKEVLAQIKAFQRSDTNTAWVFQPGKEASKYPQLGAHSWVSPVACQEMVAGGTTSVKWNNWCGNISQYIAIWKFSPSPCDTVVTLREECLETRAVSQWKFSTSDHRIPNSFRDSFPDWLLKIPDSEPSVTSYLRCYDWALSHIHIPNPNSTSQLVFLLAFQTKAQSYSPRPDESSL